MIILRVSFIIPVYNPDSTIKNILKCIKLYSLQYENEVETIVIDSSSNDYSTQFLKQEDIKLIKIKKSQFNHGGTRNKAFLLSKGEFVIFLTQDAIPVNVQSFVNLLKNMQKNPSIGMSYGRQLPKKNADFFGGFARRFNYPDKSIIKSMADRKTLGIKTVFASNSFAGYRASALRSVGGFPTNTILSEETYVAARMIKQGWSIAYEADACVYHSHNYTCLQEFKRYFDTGVFYGRESWILNTFSKAEGEGAKFATTQLLSILKRGKIYLIPSFFLRNLMKYLGYKLGIYEKFIPLLIKQKITMNKQFWKKKKK
ncbi:glycosyltransferase [Sporolactobacillus sp. THM7-7]|nr:glycosyltransferase [Sporolactobacillus sp. THM7-7]